MVTAEESIGALLEAEYGIRGSLSPLGGEGHNVKVVADDGRVFVLKLADADTPREILELERQAVELAETAGLGVGLPVFVRTRTGDIEATHAQPDGQHVRAQLLTYVPGTPWHETTRRDRGLFRDLGRLLGGLDVALARITPRAAVRTHAWDLTRGAQHRHLTALVPEAARRRILEHSFHLFASSAPGLPSLPHSLIHGDVNDENILVNDGRISGLIDFGDCLYNPTVCELAIALAYALLDLPDPLAAGAVVVAAYHDVRPLSTAELSVIFPLLCGRLAVTVAIAADRRRVDPDHPVWFITEDKAWRQLERFHDVDPADAGRALASLTGIDPFPNQGAPIEQLLEKRRRHINPALSLAYREPLKIVRGVAQYLFDDRGRPFLDLVNNVCHVGHCHPRVIDAAQHQMAVLNTNTRYVYDGLTDYAERLCATLPPPLDTCFFVNSGSEANELALRLAMAHTGRRDILVVDGAYHGNTTTLIAASPYKFMGKGGAGRAESWVHVVPLADGYRGAHKGHDRAVGEAYARDLQQVIAAASAPIAAFITESLLSCGGQVFPPEGYLEAAFSAVRAAGGVCIADEVQTGFGRVGTHFWAFEMQNVIPDIVVMGKPMGNGHPMGAVVTSRQIAASFANGMEFFSSFGGNPVSCAIGLAVLDVIRDEQLQERALEIGTRLGDGLRGLMDRHALIGDVRGAGLFIGVELVRDRTTLEPARTEAGDLVNRMKDRGILLATDGPFSNVLKIKPPMVLTADDTDMVVRVLDDELGRT